MNTFDNLGFMMRGVSGGTSRRHASEHALDTAMRKHARGLLPVRTEGETIAAGRCHCGKSDATSKRTLGDKSVIVCRFRGMTTLSNLGFVMRGVCDGTRVVISGPFVDDMRVTPC